MPRQRISAVGKAYAPRQSSRRAITAAAHEAGHAANRYAHRDRHGKRVACFHADIQCPFRRLDAKQTHTRPIRQD